MIHNSRRAPHQGTPQQPLHHAPNAALLIDFDNVTMGIRSDLGKELKALLGSEVIRGKVAVQRAYADWRRYPQYIVPLAESSIDLIFAPAYGSSKKNATDLRMAIDAMELVFTRPEIGTFILMTGDSDFSSCVLKLKEYGKYVIGVGMRESSSDLLIQNCDEYYSYHALSGLTRADDVVESKEDPWVLLKRAAQRMAANGDVMRTDRLKQVMLEMDPAFDEKAVGYSKFSRFVQEASGKGLLKLRKSENGQYEIVLDEAEAAAAAEQRPLRQAEGDGRRRRGGRGRDRDRDRGEAAEAKAAAEPVAAAEPEVQPEKVADAPAEAAAAAKPRGRRAPARSAAAARDEAPAETAAPGEEPAKAAAGPIRDMDQAFGLIQLAVRELGGKDGGGVRDGDVKRKMMELSPGFDEGDLGFSKFTRFLRQAHDSEAIDLNRVSGGNYEVSLPASGKRFAAPAVEPRREGPAAEKAQPAARAAKAPAEAAPEPDTSRTRAPAKEEAAPARGGTREAEAAPVAKPSAPSTPAPSAMAGGAQPTRTGMGAIRRRGGRPGAGEGPPPILPGQAVGTPGAKAAAAPAEAVTAPAPEAKPEEKPARGSRRGRGKAKAAEPAAKAVPEVPAKEAAAPAEPPKRKPRARAAKPKKSEAAAAPAFSADRLGLPTDRESIAAYLTNSYRGVGKKTADTLLDAFGDDVFRGLQEDPDRVRELIGARAKPLLEQWVADYGRRQESVPAAAPAASAAADTGSPKPKPRTRRGGRGGKGRKKPESSST